LFSGVIVDTGALDDALNLPSGDGRIFRIDRAVQGKEFHFAVSDVAAAQLNDPFVLPWRICTRATFLWRTRFFLKTAQMINLESIEPMIEGLPRNAKMSSRDRGVSSGTGFVVDHPFETCCGIAAQAHEFGRPPIPFVAT
jgi:hypothetical protein